MKEVMIKKRRSERKPDETFCEDPEDGAAEAEKIK